MCAPLPALDLSALQHRRWTCSALGRARDGHAPCARPAMDIWTICPLPGSRRGHVRRRPRRMSVLPAPGQGWTHGQYVHCSKLGVGMFRGGRVGSQRACSPLPVRDGRIRVMSIAQCRRWACPAGRAGGGHVRRGGQGGVGMSGGRGYGWACPRGRRGGAGGTSLAATTSRSGMTTSARRVRTVQPPSAFPTRSPIASVRPPSIRYRTTTRVPRGASERNCCGWGIGELTRS